jgi:hypothetical protein
MLIRCKQLNFGSESQIRCRKLTFNSESQIRCRTHFWQRMLIRYKQLNFGSESQICCRTHMHFQFQHIIYHQIPAELHGFNMNTHMHFQFQHTFVIKSQQSHMILTWTLTCIFLHNAFRPTSLLWPALYQVLFFPFYSLSLVRWSRNWPYFIFVACPLSCFQLPGGFRSIFLRDPSSFSVLGLKNKRAKGDYMTLTFQI